MPKSGTACTPNSYLPHADRRECRPMIRLIGLAVSIGLADSLNPSTIVPALYLATGEHPRERVIQFTVGVFVVYFVGGAAIALGPGELLLSLVPHPSHTTRYVLEVVAGAAIVIGGVFLWFHRTRLGEREPPDISGGGRGTWLLGATITIVELPTAFPYFAVIAAIVGSGLGPVRQLTLLLIFNVVLRPAAAGDRRGPDVRRRANRSPARSRTRLPAETMAGSALGRGCRCRRLRDRARCHRA